MSKIKAIRGMNDILPADTPVWQYLESNIRNILASYGYSEIRMPIVEKTQLFKRSIGEVTDIVEKEMYSFDDRRGDSLTLRPEGTAGCVRAAQEHGLLFNQMQRLWYAGAMFRYERPQKGRYRQFHQLGVETFGMAGTDIETEVILLSARLWKRLGVMDSVKLELNSLGTNAARKNYRQALVDYLSNYEKELDSDSQRRLATNPLRILDTKDEHTKNILESAPCLSAYLDDESRSEFEKLGNMLTTAGVEFELNSRLVRGLDYYSKTVFEWITDKLGAQGTVCAGGRYDSLIEQLGGRATPAFGFAMGIERLILLLETLELIPSSLYQAFDLYLAAEHKGIQSKVVNFAERLRDKFETMRVQIHCGGLKNISSKAQQTGAVIVVLVKEGKDKSLYGTIWYKDEPSFELNETAMLEKIASCWQV